MSTPKQRVQAVHPKARCVLSADYRWQVFDGMNPERALGDDASTTNFAWQHAAMKVAPAEKRAWIAQPVAAVAAPPRVTDERVLAWAKRHDLSCWDNLSEARAAFEDAQTLHLTDGVKETSGGKSNGR